MMSKINYLVGLLILLSYACTSSQMTRTDFLTGTWKMEGKEQFEVWEKTKEGSLKGHSYKIQENQNQQLETLSINKIGKQIIYEALVPNQNNGQAIPFTLNEGVEECLSFENLQHDFPQKIQYYKISSQEILVKVLGPEGKGFSYKMFKK